MFLGRHRRRLLPPGRRAVGRPRVGAERRSCCGSGARVVGWLAARRRAAAGGARDFWPSRRRLERRRIRALGRGAGRSSTTRRRWRLAGCCRRARSCRASSPTAWRSRTASGRSSSATASATTTTACERDDVRYILTYDLPSVGYESQAGLRAHSGASSIAIRSHHAIATFDVDETPAADRAALIDKRPEQTHQPAHARD